jgi:hypothetical protein
MSQGMRTVMGPKGKAVIYRSNHTSMWVVICSYWNMSAYQEPAKFAIDEAEATKIAYDFV